MTIVIVSHNMSGRRYSQYMLLFDLHLRLWTAVAPLGTGRRLRPGEYILVYMFGCVFHDFELGDLGELWAVTIGSGLCTDAMGL